MFSFLLRLFLIKVLSFFILVCLTAQTFYRTGSPTNIETDPIPGILLAGGGLEGEACDNAVKWFLERADGGDIIVIGVSGDDWYNNYYESLGVEINSVTTIGIPDREAADNPAVYDTIINGEALFIMGGNQWNYVNHWKNSLVHDAIDYLLDEKGITIYGTSAGLAILGEVVYSAENGTVWSTEALDNPYHHRVTLEKDFLNVPYLEELVTDSHLNRVQGDDHDRKGRFVTFMARMIADWNMNAKGVGVNDYTMVAVDENGLARVFGDPDYDDYAYFLNSNNSIPEVCEEDTPLHWDNDSEAIVVYSIKGNTDGNNYFDLQNWADASGGVWKHWYVLNGTLYSSPFGEMNVVFNVKHGVNEDPISQATVYLEGYGERYTNSAGVAVFEGVEPEEEVFFEVSKQGFYNDEGYLNVTNQNVEQNVFLYPKDDTNVSEVPLKSQAKFFPNPLSGNKLNFEINDIEQESTLAIYTLKGSLVYSRLLQPAESKQLNIDVSGWPSGVYLFSIKNDNIIITDKIVRY